MPLPVFDFTWVAYWWNSAIQIMCQVINLLAPPCNSATPKTRPRVQLVEP